jgi:hypothetical protein
MENIYENDLNKDSQWGIIKSNKFKVNKKSNKRAWVIDNFYENPDAVREYALSATYFDRSTNHGGVGWRTRKQYIFDGVREKIETTMGAAITNWAPEYSVCGVFQAGFGDSDGMPPLVYHIDSQQFAAMVFLTPNAPFETGTKIVANKKSKIYHSSQSNNVLDYFPQQETFVMVLYLRMLMCLEMYIIEWLFLMDNLSTVHVVILGIVYQLEDYGKCFSLMQILTDNS